MEIAFQITEVLHTFFSGPDQRQAALSPFDCDGGSSLNSLMKQLILELLHQQQNLTYDAILVPLPLSRKMV